MESIQDLMAWMKDQAKNSTKASTITQQNSYNCKECQDTGVVIINHNTARQCECVREAARKARLKKLISFADIPVDFKDLNLESFSLDHYKNQKAMQIAKQTAIKYIHKFKEMQSLGKGLYFYSNTPGSGKTRMAISIGNELMELHNIVVKYTTVEQLNATIQATFNRDSNTSNVEIIDSFKGLDVLILDDLAVENTTQWSESILYSILDYRVDNRKPTIYTSNHSIDKLPYHHRIKSRINKSSLQIHFAEESIRDSVAKKENLELMKYLLGGE